MGSGVLADPHSVQLSCSNFRRRVTDHSEVRPELQFYSAHQLWAGVWTARLCFAAWGLEGPGLERSPAAAPTVTRTVSDAVGCGLGCGRSGDAHLCPLWAASCSQTSYTAVRGMRGAGASKPGSRGVPSADLALGVGRLRAHLAVTGGNINPLLLDGGCQ